MLRRLPVLLLVLLGLLAGAWHATAMATAQTAPLPAAAADPAMDHADMDHADCHEAAMAGSAVPAPNTGDGHEGPGCCDGTCTGGCLMVASLPAIVRPDLPLAEPTRFVPAAGRALPTCPPPALFHPPRTFA